MFGQLASVRTTLESMARAYEPSSLGGFDTLRVAEELGAIKRLVDGLIAKTACRVDATGAWGLHGERNAADAVARTMSLSPGEARTAIATGERLEALPLVDAAVRAGWLSARSASLVTEAAAIDPGAQEELLDAAARGFTPLRDVCIEVRARVEDPAERAARLHRQRFLRTWTDSDGMFAGSFRLTPEVGGQVKAAIDAAAQRTFRKRRAGDDHEPHEAYAADALSAFVLGGGSRATTKANVHIVIDYDSLARGAAGDGERCEIPGVGPVSAAWARQLLGDAFLTAVIAKGKDIKAIAHLGRHVPAELQTALLVAGRECDADGCHDRGYLERDHVHDHAKGGTTAFWNLCWLCYRHHRLKTSGWILGPPDVKTRKRKLRPPPARAA